MASVSDFDLEDTLLIYQILTEEIIFSELML